MRTLLNDEGDTSASLEKQIREFRRAREEAAPSLHATTHVADRVLQVMERKLEVLDQLRSKAEDYSLAKRDVEGTLRRALQGADVCQEAFASAADGFRSLLLDSFGECPNLDEQSDWPGFLRRLRLPPDHACITGAQQMLEEGEREWGATAAALCREQADQVVLPKEVRRKRAEERKMKRVFMKAFPEVKHGVTADQVEAVLGQVQRMFSAARLLGNITERSPYFAEMAEVEKDLRAQAFILRSGGAEGVKIKDDQDRELLVTG